MTHRGATAAAASSPSPSSIAASKDDAARAKAAVLNEVRDLIQGLKEEAINVSKAVHHSDSMLEQRQRDLAAQLADTQRANRRATEAEKLAQIDAGAVGEALLRLCGKVMPKMMVDSFVRPLVASVFQILWIALVVVLTMLTAYVIMTSPKKA